MFRPQYSYSTPAGYIDIPYVRPVNIFQDASSTLPPGQFLTNFVIKLDEDVDQLFRSLFWQGAQQGQGASPTAGSIQIQMRNSFGVFLTDGYVPLWLLFWGAGSTPPDGGSGRAKVFEPEIYCPRGSVLLMDFFNPDGGTYTWPGLFELRGVKRQAKC